MSNKPTFEEYLKQPAYPSEINKNDGYMGLTKLEAFTMDGFKCVLVGLDNSDGKIYEWVVGEAKKQLKALYDKQYPEEVKDGSTKQKISNNLCRSAVEL